MERIVVDLENLFCALDPDKKYEAYVPELGDMAHPGVVFRVKGMRIKAWPEYVYSMKVGNIVVYGEAPQGVSKWPTEEYYIADKSIVYAYRLKEHDGIQHL